MNQFLSSVYKSRFELYRKYFIISLISCRHLLANTQDTIKWRQHIRRIISKEAATGYRTYI